MRDANLQIFRYPLQFDKNISFEEGEMNRNYSIKKALEDKMRIGFNKKKFSYVL